MLYYFACMVITSLLLLLATYFTKSDKLDDGRICTFWHLGVFFNRFQQQLHYFLEFHVQLHFIELKMYHRLVVEIGAGCLCRWVALLCTIASWCQQRNFIFILCTFVLHWLSNLNQINLLDVFTHLFVHW